MDVQRSAQNAITHSMKVMPRALKGDAERGFMLKKENQAALVKLLQDPEAAMKFDKFIASQGIDFPARTRINSFFTSVVQGVYGGELQFRDDLYKGAKSKNAEQMATAITRYRDTLRKHGIERDELDLQKKGMKYLANRDGISLNDAFTKYGEMIREAARIAKFKEILTRSGLIAGSAAARSQASKMALAYGVAANLAWSRIFASERMAIAEDVTSKDLKEEGLRREASKMAAREKAAEAVPALAAAPEAKSLNEADIKVRQMLADFETAVAVGSAGAAAPPANPGTPGPKAAEAPKPDGMVANPRMRKPEAPEMEVAKPPSFGGGAAARAPKAVAAPPAEERYAEAVREIRRVERKAIGPDESGKAASGTTERLLDNVAKSHGSQGSIKALKDHLDGLASAILAAAKPKAPPAPKTAMR